MKRALTSLAFDRPRAVVLGTVLLTAFFVAWIPRIRIDTDPENMLPADEPVRVHHARVEEDFGLHDYIVVGIVRDDETGVFRPATLERTQRLTDAILQIDGVVADQLIAPSEVDDISTTGDGMLRVASLMETPPETDEEARAVLDRIRANPILRGKLAADDGRSLALFVPIETKDMAHEIAREIRVAIDEIGGDEEYHLAGIPLAEDTFGTEMFLQMAIGAPAAFGLIFLLMLYFFRKPRLVLGPMIVAMVSVIWTMGLLIALGFPVHIMSSMIPVFLIPIAVLDAIHVLSEFHERYPRSGDRRRAMAETIDELFVPMTYTSLTTIVGFGSLVLTPIPPVQVFGAFVAFGVGTAWLLTLTFLVAYGLLLPEKALRDFGYAEERDPLGDRVMQGIRRWALGRSRLLVGLGVLVFALSLAGLSRIQVNDNPVNWFRANHPMRVADRVMNEHLAGTYLAYLALESDDDGAIRTPDALHAIERLQRRLESDPNVGGTTSVADIVKKVRGELLGGSEHAVIPNSAEEIAQYLFLYEISGGDPDDLFHFVTPDGRSANLWVQMRRGENRDVAAVVATASQHLDEDPVPGATPAWAGLPYINIVWQQKMVAGMGRALAGSFVVVFAMMAILFRSIRLGLLSMIPLTATIVLVYGAIGWAGKAYDMPIAVLSSLALGLSVDFAIHFLQRSREAYDRHGNLASAMEEVFQAPARAITRNVFVIALGFVPMFFANLIPYVTVSVFFFAIMLVSGISTMIALPALLTTFGSSFLASRRARN